MATINGLQIRGLKSFIGHEGECYQGNLYLNNKKIGFWSQDSNGCIQDNLDLDREYSEGQLRKEIIVLNKDKAIKGKSLSGQDYVLEYDLEKLMTDLLVLIDDEKAFKKAVKEGYSMTLVVSDYYHVSTWKLSGPYLLLTDEELIKKLDKEITQAKSKMFKNEEIKIKIYRSLDDFNIGEKISLNSIRR